MRSTMAFGLVVLATTQSFNAASFSNAMN